MTITIIQERLNQYQSRNPIEEQNALKEITQEIALMVLSRLGFFKVAQFHGGTALRILYDLPRFSEDLDFTLLAPDHAFDLSRYLDPMVDEFIEYGYRIEVSDRSKSDNVIKKAFLKDDSIGKQLQLTYSESETLRKKIKIKLEVDVNPPAGAVSEMKYLAFPLPFAVLCQDLASSFSGKIHALLCRPYMKGRDWFDFVWYVGRRARVNFDLLGNALHQHGPWKGSDEVVDARWLREKLEEKIRAINWGETKEDVRVFLKSRDQQSLDVWSQDFFLSVLSNLSKTIA